MTSESKVQAPGGHVGPTKATSLGAGSGGQADPPRDGRHRLDHAEAANTLLTQVRTGAVIGGPTGGSLSTDARPRTPSDGSVSN